MDTPNTNNEQQAAPQIDFSGDIFKLAVESKLTTEANREGFDAFERPSSITFISVSA